MCLQFGSIWFGWPVFRYTCRALGIIIVATEIRAAAAAAAPRHMLTYRISSRIADTIYMYVSVACLPRGPNVAPCANGGDDVCLILGKTA